jgi:hypothetical protein
MSRIELFVGYESGAVGGFRVFYDHIKDKLSFKQVLSTQKIIQDPNIHHLLSMEVMYMKAQCEDIKLVVGYYGNILQTIDFTRGSDGDAYIMVSQNMTAQTYSEKPGIGAIASLIHENNKGLIVTGGFDHRVRMVSARSLKMLLSLNFHKGIVNRVEIEKGKEKGQVIVHSISEDGYYS